MPSLSGSRVTSEESRYQHLVQPQKFLGPALAAFLDAFERFAAIPALVIADRPLGSVNLRVTRSTSLLIDRAPNQRIDDQLGPRLVDQVMSVAVGLDRFRFLLL
jgi:hypothetical protein